MSFYGYTQLINVNDWKIDKDKEVANLKSISPSSSTELNSIYKINYNLGNGYQANYDTDKEEANKKEGSAFASYVGATWGENQGYDGTIWQVRSNNNEYYLVKLANTNSVIPQISVDYYSPSYGEENNLPRFDKEHSNPAGFILQASPNWKIDGELIGETNCLTGPDSTNIIENFETSSQPFQIIEELEDNKYSDKEDPKDLKRIQLDLTTLNSALGLLYNIIYGTDAEKREELIKDTNYFQLGQPGLLSFLKSNNNEVSYQTIILDSNGSFNSETKNYDWTFITDINSNNAISVELLINETDDVNANQAVYCDFEITSWEENEIIISGISIPTENIKLALKYTH